MGDGIIGKFIYFWAFIIGVIVFGKVFGFMNDSKSTIMILIASAIVYIVWVIARSKAKQRNEQRAWEEKQRNMKGKGNKRR